MGDGKVALILDVLGIAQRAKVVSEVRDRARSESAHGQADGASDMQTLLLFRVGDSDRMAMPLDLVARLEEFQRSSIERSGDQEVVQYRNEILPLVSLSKFFTGADASTVDLRQVVVFAEKGRSVGLVVDQILDIVSEHVVVQRHSSRVGVLGSAVIQHRVTDLLDVHAVMHSTDPTFFKTADAAA
jgi:two-component system chemotaxis sensor kinase CheA